MREYIEEQINEKIESLGYGKVNVIYSGRKDLCDFQCNDAFRLAKIYHKAPNLIGEEIINLIKDFDIFSKVEFVNPGFINIKVSDKLINKFIREMNDNPKFNLKKPDKIETFVIDYGGYNVAKPLHIGHLRPTIIGESIKRIISYKGHKTIGDVHLGDYGLQMGQVIYGIKRDNLKIEDITIDYLNKIYPEISALCKEDEKVREECVLITKMIQDGDKYYNELLDRIIEISVSDAKKTTDYLGITFDLWHGERDSYPYLEKCEKMLRDKNLLTLSEGALVVNVKKEEDNKPMPPMMFKKSNGAYVYDSTDLATIYERYINYNPNHIIYITDFRQNLHFEQVFRVSDMVGLIPYECLEHAYNGTINGKDGKAFKTRKGDAPKLSELFDLVKDTFISLKEENKNMNKEDIDKIVNAIIKFADLQNSRDKDYIFDIEKFSQVVGKTGPYILYTYLRIQKILKDNSIENNLNDIIYNEKDRNLRMKLLEFETSFDSAFKERKPNYIAEYVYNVAILANNFYENNHIMGLEDLDKKNSWLYILNLTNKILKDMLYLLEIEIPSFM